MKKNQRTLENTKIIPVVINGVKYLTWPQTQLFTGWERDVLRQKLEKEKIKPLAIEPYYLFVKYDDCVQLRDGEAKEKDSEKIKRNLTKEQLNKLAELLESNLPETEKLLKMLVIESEGSENNSSKTSS